MATVDDRSLVVRWLTADDVAAAVEIDRACFGPDALDASEFNRLINSRRTVALAAELGGSRDRPHPWSKRGRSGETVGCLVYRLDADAIQVLRVAVAPAARRRGVGAALMEAVARKAAPRRPVCRAAASDANLDAHLWLRSIGWRCVGVDRDGGDYVFERTYRDAKGVGDARARTESE